MQRRKLKQTFNIPGHAHYLTYSCRRHLPLLSRDRACWWVIEALENTRHRLDFALWAYVILVKRSVVVGERHRPQHARPD